MRVANNYHDWITIKVDGTKSYVKPGTFCTHSSQSKYLNVKLSKADGTVIFDEQSGADYSIIIGRDGKKYNTKYGKIWMAEDGTYP